jgi:hypothetical protein
MQHYSSVKGLLNQTRNGCGLRILKNKTCAKKEQKKNNEKRKIVILRICPGLEKMEDSKSITGTITSSRKIAGL